MNGPHGEVLWTGQQCEWLQAMGHRPWVLASDETPMIDVSVTDSAQVTSALRVPALPASAAAPVADKPVPVPDSRPTPASHPEPLPIADRLLQRALLRATGQRTRRAAEEMLQRVQADPASLRTDAAGKRALWKQLRTLRKAAQRQ